MRPYIKHPKLDQTEFVCELCGKTFPKHWAGNTTRRFCSVKCRNTFLARKQISKTGKRCPVCGKLKWRQKDPTCIKCGAKIKGHPYWKPEEIEYVKNHYSSDGPDAIAKFLDKSKGSISCKAYGLSLKISKETLDSVSYRKIRERMIKNNPMKNPLTRQKVKNWINNHPETQKRIMEALNRGHQKLEKTKPSKLEFKLREILTKHGINFEPSALIGNKIVVDIKIGNIIIQADGDWWHGHPRFEPLNERQITQQKRDRSHDAYLSACGFKVVRFWEKDFSENKILSILREHNLICENQIIGPNPSSACQEGMIGSASNF